MTTPIIIGIQPTKFQLTSSRRGWLSQFKATGTYGLFQLTSSRRGWQAIVNCLNSIERFQLTSSRRGWQVQAQEIRRRIHFNSHPHEEDDVTAERSKLKSGYFNSHPHEEDDSLSLVVILIFLIFQLTSSRRGWLPSQLASSHGLSYFNSHPHEEDDPNLLLQN